MSKVPEFDFLPATRAVAIGRDVVYRPIRSWHSGVLAGEGRDIERGDRSGCIVGQLRGMTVALPPKSATHRMYWNTETGASVSAFLSYPNGMSPTPFYHWELLFRGPDGSDVERYTSEEELEAVVLATIGSPPRCDAHADCRADRALAESCAALPQSSTAPEKP